MINEVKATITEGRAESAGQLAKERLNWALFPIAALIVMYFWVLNPVVVDQPYIIMESIWGFMLGAGVGIIRFRKEIPQYINLSISKGVYRKNRVPEEFYWGDKKERLWER